MKTEKIIIKSSGWKHQREYGTIPSRRKAKYVILDIPSEEEIAKHQAEEIAWKIIYSKQSGEISCTWTGLMLPSVKQTLIDNGYSMHVDTQHEKHRREAEYHIIWDEVS